MLSRYILLSLVVSCGYGLQAKRFSQPRVTVPHETADSSSVEEGTYQPTWESIDSRPLPSWYDQSKIGVFFHWGVFSVPSFDNEWFWFSWVNNHSNVVSFMEQNYPPRFTYQDFGREFTAEFYDPHRWVKTLKKSGAK
jgi:alpha-L-fucosidase